VFPRNTVAGLGFDNSPGSIHRGGANVLFCDGHVQWFLKRDLVVRWPVIAEEGAKQRMWNIDNRPAKW